MLIRLLALLLLALPAQAADTLTGRMVVGYQGWFDCPDDGFGPPSWHHWFLRGPDGALRPTFDLWPDMRELPPEEHCATGLSKPDGRAAPLFSSQNPATVARHLRWMREHGIEAAALQRFISAFRDPVRRAGADRVMDSLAAAALAEQRSWFVMYDLSGLDAGSVPAIAEEFARLAARGVLRHPAYQRHDGRPVLGLWGIGFAGREATAADWRAVLDAAREQLGEVTLLLGVPAWWREGVRDGRGGPEWQELYARGHILSPWAVGRFADTAGAERYARETLAADLALARARGQEVMPVIFPGFSWTNLMQAHGRAAPRNQIARRCGAFYWSQARAAMQAGARLLYTAMFDELDEGTAIMPIAPSRADTPEGGRFLAADEDGCALPADWYLRLAGAVQRGLAEGSLPAAPPAP
jgi:hypothetical protein